MVGTQEKNFKKKAITCEVQVAKQSELHQFQEVPKIWIVECSFAWLEKYRQLFKNVGES